MQRSRLNLSSENVNRREAGKSKRVAGVSVLLLPNINQRRNG
jgi:hypothetical protein